MRTDPDILAGLLHWSCAECVGLRSIGVKLQPYPHLTKRRGFLSNLDLLVYHSVFTYTEPLREVRDLPSPAFFRPNCLLRIFT